MKKKKKAQRKEKGFVWFLWSIFAKELADPWAWTTAVRTSETRMETSLHFHGLPLSPRSKVHHSWPLEVNSWGKRPILCSSNWAQLLCPWQTFLLLCTPRNSASASYCNSCMGAHVKETFIWKEDTLQTDMQIKAISKEMQQTHMGACTRCVLSKFSILLIQPSLEVPLAQQVMFDSVVMRWQCARNRKFISFVFLFLCYSKGWKGHHFKFNLQGILSICWKHEEADLVLVFIRHMPPICLSWVEEDLLLILQTHLQGVQNADQKARQDEVYLIKKTAPEVTGNHSEEEIAFDHVTSREGGRGRGMGEAGRVLHQNKTVAISK